MEILRERRLGGRGVERTVGDRHSLTGRSSGPSAACAISLQKKPIRGCETSLPVNTSVGGSTLKRSNWFGQTSPPGRIGPPTKSSAPRPRLPASGPLGANVRSPKSAATSLKRPNASPSGRTPGRTMRRTTLGLSTSFSTSATSPLPGARRNPAVAAMAVGIHSPGSASRRIPPSPPQSGCAWPNRRSSVPTTATTTLPWT